MVSLTAMPCVGVKWFSCEVFLYIVALRTLSIQYADLRYGDITDSCYCPDSPATQQKVLYRSLLLLQSATVASGHPNINSGSCHDDVFPNWNYYGISST